MLNKKGWCDHVSWCEEEIKYFCKKNNNKNDSSRKRVINLNSFSVNRFSFLDVALLYFQFFLEVRKNCQIKYAEMNLCYREMILFLEF